MTVQQLTESMSVAEFVGWIAYFDWKNKSSKAGG